MQGYEFPMPGADPERLPDHGPASPLHGRIRFLALAVISCGLAFLLLKPEADPPKQAAAAPWSIWKPAADRTQLSAVAQQVAAHVGPRYQLDGGTPLAGAKTETLAFSGKPLVAAIRSLPGSGGETTMFPGRTSVVYRLCGAGPGCTVAPGQPSNQRHTVLRREGLELALYTLHYSDADEVIVYLPPRAGAAPGTRGQALFFQRPGLTAPLRIPLDSTLTTDVPRPAQIRHWPDRLTVENTTIPALFTYTVQPARAGLPSLLVLDPVVGAAPAQPRRLPSTASPA